MVRAAIVTSVLLFGAGAASAAPDATIVVGPGSVAYWASAYAGSVDRFNERILVQGDGFELYETHDQYASGEPSDYYALFSGIYYTGCDEDMPTAEERALVKTLYPLAVGKSVEIGATNPTKIEIEAATEIFLMGQTWPAHKIKIEYQGDDPSEETVIVLDHVPLTARIDWDDDSKDTLLLVTSPKPQSLAELDLDLIGTCASLLNK